VCLLSAAVMAQVSPLPSRSPQMPPTAATSSTTKPAENPRSAADVSDLPDRSNATESDIVALLPELSPLPPKKATLIGGTVIQVDQIRDQLMLRPFGQNKSLKLFFDPRTAIFQDGTRSNRVILHRGDRIYADTMLVESRIYAKAIHVQAHSGGGQGSGQLAGYDPSSGEFTVRDSLALEPIKLRVSPATVIRRGDKIGSARDLQPGALVSYKFHPDPAGYARVEEISILADRGGLYTFYGRVTYLNLRTNLMAVTNSSDDKNYEINIEPSQITLAKRLHEGDMVNVSAEFDGIHYAARSISMEKASSEKIEPGPER